MTASSSNIEFDGLENLEELELIELIEMENNGITKMNDSLESCINLLLFGNILLALLIGVVCAFIFSRFLDVKH